MFESSSICTFLAESVPEKALIVALGEKDRALFLQWQSICLETLEEGWWIIFSPELVGVHQKQSA